MSNRSDADGSIRAAADILSELNGLRVTTDASVANATRAQAVATAAVAQALLALDDTFRAANAATGLDR